MKFINLVLLAVALPRSGFTVVAFPVTLAPTTITTGHSSHPARNVHDGPDNPKHLTKLKDAAKAIPQAAHDQVLKHKNAQKPTAKNPVYIHEVTHELLPRNLFPAHGTYSKDNAINFVKSIPPEKLEGFGNTQRTVYSSAKDGHRLDMQSMALSKHSKEPHHNIQVQINGDRAGKKPLKTTVGGLLVKGTWSAKRTRKELVHSIMHPARDKHGNEYMRKQKEGQAPPRPNSTQKKRKPKFNPRSRKNRKAAKKGAFQ